MLQDTNITWTPGIGDPTTLGWVTVILYFIAAYFCIKVSRNSHLCFSSEIKRQQFFWLALGCLLVFLGVNKQIDLQSLFTQVAKFIAIDQGWYGQRRIYQAMFIKGLIVTTLTALVGLALIFKKTIHSQWLAIIGVCFLACFVLIRATSFHHVDQLINHQVFGVRVNALLELPGIILIIINTQFIRLKKSVQL